MTIPQEAEVVHEFTTKGQNVMLLRSTILFAIATLVIGQATVFAATPALKLGCGTPSSQQVVTCRLSGFGFHPREVVRITYRITFTALPRQHGKRPQTVYRRTATTDRRGQFTRPSLGFAVVKYRESFRMTVAAVGSSGDRASVNYVAIAQ